MVLKLTLKDAINGYWDGGAKKIFEWSIQHGSGKDKKGEFVRVGSWSANFWFCVSKGKTEKATLANAKRKLTSMLHKRGIYDYNFEYVETH